MAELSILDRLHEYDGLLTKSRQLTGQYSVMFEFLDKMGGILQRTDKIPITHETNNGVTRFPVKDDRHGFQVECEVTGSCHKIKVRLYNEDGDLMGSSPMPNDVGIIRMAPGNTVTLFPADRGLMEIAHW